MLRRSEGDVDLQEISTYASGIILGCTYWHMIGLVIPADIRVYRLQLSVLLEDASGRRVDPHSSGVQCASDLNTPLAARLQGAIHRGEWSLYPPIAPDHNGTCYALMLSSPRLVPGGNSGA